MAANDQAATFWPKLSVYMCILCEVLPTHADFMFGAVTLRCLSCAFVTMVVTNLMVIGPLAIFWLKVRNPESGMAWNRGNRLACGFVLFVHAFYIVLDVWSVCQILAGS